MKNLLKSFVFVATVVTTLISCQEEMNSPMVKETVKLTVHAKAENLSGVGEDTKTYISGNSVLWGTDEFMTAALVSGDDFATYKSSENSADFWEGENEAHFEFDVELSARSVTYGGVYPTSAVVTSNNTNPKSFKVELGAGQKATADSYDPSAYIMIAKPETFDAATNEWIASFRRATALNKITLTGLTEDISSVVITAPSTSALSGRRYFDLTTGESGDVYTNQSNAITVIYDSPLTEDDKDVWFTSWETTIASGEALTIKATSNAHTYTRTITAKASGISFKEGFLNKLSVNMAADDVVVEDVVDYSGDYLIVSGAHLLTDFNAEKSYYNYADAQGSELSDFWKIANIEDYVWTVAKLADGSYSFCNAGSGKYLALTADSNNAHESEETNEDTAMTITKEDDASLTIQSKEFNGRNLRYNTTSPRFAFYASTNGTAATLLAYTPDERPHFDAVTLNWDSTNKTISWTAVDGATNGYEYTTDNGTTVTAVDASPIDCSSWTNGDYSVKVRVVGTDTKKTSEWSSACEFTISGGVMAKYYRKVTSLLDNYEGTFLILGTGTTNAFTGTGSGWGASATVTVDNEKGILSNSTVDAYAVTISKLQNGNYTILASNNNYIASVSSNTFSMGSTAGEFTFEYSDGHSCVKLSNGRYMKFVSGSGFRMYSSATGVFSDLYKLDEVAVTSIAVSGTPEMTSYLAGDSFDVEGLVATATYADASQKNVTADVEWTITPATLSAGTTSVSVVATYKSVSSEAFVVSGLSVKELSSISIKTAPAKTIYTEGEKFDPTGLVINMNYSDESAEEVAYSGNESDFTFSPTTSTALTPAINSVTISYSGKSVNQAITVNEKPAVTTMDGIFTAANEAGSTATDIKVKFTDCVITGVKNNNAYLTDNNGKGLIIYTSGHGFEVGDILNGTVNCKVQLYNGASELTNLKSNTDGLTVTKDGVAIPQTISIANLSGVNTGAVLTFTSLTYNGTATAFSDGVNVIKPYNSFITLPTLTSGRNYQVQGVYVQYNNTKEIAPRTAEDFKLIVEPYLLASATKTNISAAGETISINVDTNIEGWTVESDNAAFVVGAKSGDTVPVVVSENTSTTDDRTAKITVSATGVDPVEITLSQAKASSGGGTEQVYKTAKFGSAASSGKSGDYLSTNTFISDGFSVIVANGNTNNNQWDLVKFGRKNYDSVGSITTSDAIDKAVTKVTIDIDDITTSKVKSIILYSGTSAESCTTEEGNFTMSKGKQTVTISNPAASKYYKVEFNCSSGTSNGLVSVKTVEYYAEY